MAIIEKRKTQEGSQRFRVRVPIKGYPAQSETFNRLTDARRWAQQTEAAIRERRYFPTLEARKHTLAELIDRYIKEVLPRKPKQAYDQTCQLKWWKLQLGAYALSEITPALLTEKRNKLIEHITVRGTNRTPGSANRYLAALGHAFTIASTEWAWIDDNPFRKVKRLREPRGRTRFLSDDELKRLLESCKESHCPYLLLVVTLAVATGMRYSEILELTWKDINLKEGYLILSHTKNGTQRRVPLHGRALELFIKHSHVRRIDTQLVFPSIRPDRPLDIRSAWEEARERAKIEDFRFHDLRHSAASYLAMSGATTRDIAEILGHKTLQMVVRYAHLADTHVSEVVARMNEKVFGRID